jgi:hypothetical protein
VLHRHTSIGARWPRGSKRGQRQYVADQGVRGQVRAALRQRVALDDY